MSSFRRFIALVGGPIRPAGLRPEADTLANFQTYLIMESGWHDENWNIQQRLLGFSLTRPGNYLQAPTGNPQAPAYGTASI